MQLDNFHFTLGIVAILLILYILYKLKYKKRVVIDMVTSPAIENFTADSNVKKEVDEVVSKYNQFNK